MNLKPTYLAGLGIGLITTFLCTCIILLMYFLNPMLLLSYPSGVNMLLCILAMIVGVRYCHQKAAPEYSLLTVGLGVFLIFALAWFGVELTYSILYSVDAEFLELYRDVSKNNFREQFGETYKETELKDFDAIVDATHPAAFGEFIMRFGLRMLPGLAVSFFIAFVYRIYKNRSTI